MGKSGRQWIDSQWRWEIWARDFYKLLKVD
jgi:hypothetical protein